MHKFNDLRRFFDDPPVLALNIAENDIHYYRIEMKNDYLDPLGAVIKQEYLKTVYNRKIVETISHNLFFTEITTSEVVYETKEKELHWTFAEGTKIPYYLYFSHYMDEYIFLDAQLKEDGGSLRTQMGKASEIFLQFPKFPSVSLYILQLHDILGFDILASQSLSSPLLLHKPSESIEMKHMSDTKCDLEGGTFAGGSFFKHSKIFARYHGLTLLRDNVCSVFEFYCDGAKLDTNDAFRTKKGTSTYSFILYIDHQTGLLVKGYLQENISASQGARNEPDKMSPAPARRRVNVELLDEDEL